MKSILRELASVFFFVFVFVFLDVGFGFRPDFA